MTSIIGEQGSAGTAVGIVRVAAPNALAKSIRRIVDPKQERVFISDLLSDSAVPWGPSSKLEPKAECVK